MALILAGTIVRAEALGLDRKTETMCKYSRIQRSPWGWRAGGEIEESPHLKWSMQVDTQRPVDKHTTACPRTHTHQDTCMHISDSSFQCKYVFSPLLGVEFGRLHFLSPSFGESRLYSVLLSRTRQLWYCLLKLIYWVLHQVVFILVCCMYTFFSYEGANHSHIEWFIFNVPHNFIVRRLKLLLFRYMINSIPYAFSITDEARFSCPTSSLCSWKNRGCPRLRIYYSQLNMSVITH